MSLKGMSLKGKTLFITGASRGIGLAIGLRVARAALAEGGAAPTVMNAANEIAVAAFIRGAIPFYGIAELVEQAVERFAAEFRRAPEDVEEALAIDARVRAWSLEAVPAARAAG